MSAFGVALVVTFAALTAFAVGRWLSLRAALANERRSSESALRDHDALVHAQAIAGERERIYNDLHDDLGASLLHLIYSAPTPHHADAARAVLQNLRDVVTRSRGTPGTLGDVLTDIRSEANQRLLAVGIELDWTESEDCPDPVLDIESALHLHRIVREAISNVIRHAQARRLRVRVRHGGGRLGIELTDDGSGTVASPRGGVGMQTMRNRADELAANIDWRAGTEGGTKVLLEMPLPAGAVT